MKRLSTACLFVCLTLGAWAQNKTKMTEDEKKEALEQLELLYRYETGLVFDGLDLSADRAELRQEVLPWDEWTDKYGNRGFDKNLSRLFACFEHASLEPKEDAPGYCCLMLRGKKEGSGSFGGWKGSGLWEKWYHKNENGNFTGFRKDLFFGLETDLQLHLTDRQGQPVYLHPEEDIYLLEGGDDAGADGMSDIWFGIQIPLTVPWSEVGGGEISLSFCMPSEYDRITVPIAGFGDEPVEVTWGSKTFSIEKVDSRGFILAADEPTLEKLKPVEYFYCRDGVWYKPSSSTAATGDLDDLLQYGTGTVAFEEWMARKGIDPDNLEETLERFMSEDESSAEDDAGVQEAGPTGKCYRTALQGDSLLLWMPAERSRAVADIRVFVPSEGEQSRVEIDRRLCGELLECLRTGKSPDRNRDTGSGLSEADGCVANGAADAGLPACVVAKFDAPKVRGASATLKEGAELSAEEWNALLASDERISYAAGVVQASLLASADDGLAVDDGQLLRTALLSPEGQADIFTAFEAGLRKHRELIERSMCAPEAGDAAPAALEEALTREREVSARAGNIIYGMAYVKGLDALTSFRHGAAYDRPDRRETSGLRVDMEQVVRGFRDYIQGHLNMGVAYARTLTESRRIVVDWSQYWEFGPEEVDYFDPGFRPAKPINPRTGMPDEWHVVLAQSLKKPEEAVEQGLSGRMTVDVTIEADGVVSGVKVNGDPHPLLAQAVCDCIYRMTFAPAVWKETPISFVGSIPFIFN